MHLIFHETRNIYAIYKIYKYIHIDTLLKINDLKYHNSLIFIKSKYIHVNIDAMKKRFSKVIFLKKRIL